MILGAIGDDFTGSSDLANTLAREGMRATLFAGVPAEAADPGTEAGVVALKSRTIPAAQAVAQSLAALDWLRAQGCQQFLFKICSTFDSTDAGNIGPVGEALAAALGARAVPVCPAFPATGRTVYLGHLFVGDRLLSESGMEHHPLTPMRDPDLRRVLARQTRLPVGHVPLTAVRRGAGAIRETLDAFDGFAIVDAVADADLRALGEAAEGLPLLVGGSGIAIGLPAVFARHGLLAGGQPSWTGDAGPALAVAGSVSRATQAQVAAHIAAGHPARALDPDAVMAGRETAAALVDWALSAGGLPLVYSTADAASVAAAQARHGRAALAEAIERLLAATAAEAVARGVRRLVAAGGETSGAVVSALALRAMAIGPEIDPGVPALRAEGRPLALALKSGNFGGPDFFARALAMLG